MFVISCSFVEESNVQRNERKYNFPSSKNFSSRSLLQRCIHTLKHWKLDGYRDFEWRDRVIGNESASLIAQVPSTMRKYLTPIDSRARVLFHPATQFRDAPSEAKFRNIWCRLIPAVDSCLPPGIFPPPLLRRLGSLSISAGKTIVRTLSIELEIPLHPTDTLSLSLVTRRALREFI